MEHRNIAIVLAGGKGSRFGSETPKQFLNIGNKTVIEYSVDAFENSPVIDEIWIVVLPEYFDRMRNLMAGKGWKKVTKLIEGGSERHYSTLNALKECEDDGANLIFHDAARPAVSGRIIADVVSALRDYEACAVAVPAKDTIFKVSEDGNFVEEIPARKDMCMAQTPQAFRAGVIKQAYEKALGDGFKDITDDCGVVHRYLPEVKIRIVVGDVSNMKLTTQVDGVLLGETLKGQED